MLEFKAPESREDRGSRHRFGLRGNMTAMNGGRSQIGIGMRKDFAGGAEVRRTPHRGARKRFSRAGLATGTVQGHDQGHDPVDPFDILFLRGLP